MLEVLQDSMMVTAMSTLSCCALLQADSVKTFVSQKIKFTPVNREKWNLQWLLTVTFM
jgi:hypothetical protein